MTSNSVYSKIVKFQSYSDYPQSATNNAKRALDWADKNGWGSCLEATGKQRANQLAKREPISRDTIARMASFKRHQQYKDVPYSEGCGGLAWDAWGGTSGVEWAINKLKEIDLTEVEIIVCRNCGWEWNIKDGGDSPYVCHKCGFNNE